MSTSTYAAALSRLLAHEGGYTNHPDDPGGPTKFGITIADYRREAKADATAADVRAMSVDEAKSIYRRRYWDAQRCDELPAGIDYAVFDYGVNSGIGRSGKVLRRVLGLSDKGGKISDHVIDAARGADAETVIAAICDERLRFLKSLKTWDVFGRGWSRRVAEVRAFSLSLAGSEPAPAKTMPAPKAAGGAVAGAAAAAAAAQGGAAPWGIVAIALVAVIAGALAAHMLVKRKG
jgi:lysozyme family protein